MSPKEIKVGKSYHNGKQGPRSYSERKVIAMNITTYWPGGGIKDGVRYEQVAGMYKGQITVLSLASFASWAKGEVST